MRPFAKLLWKLVILLFLLITCCCFYFLFSLTPISPQCSRTACDSIFQQTLTYHPIHASIHQSTPSSRGKQLYSPIIIYQPNATHNALCNKSVLTASHLGSRHDATRIRSSGAGSYRSISAARAQAAASGRCRSTGQTDGRTPDRYIDPCTAYYAGGVSKVHATIQYRTIQITQGCTKY